MEHPVGGKLPFGSEWCDQSKWKRVRSARNYGEATMLRSCYKVSVWLIA